MLNIHIDDPELERDIRQTFGDDARSIARAFSRFIQQQRIRQDIGVSIEQLEAGESTALGDVVKDIRTKYE
jgi:hypothetical protein